MAHDHVRDGKAYTSKLMAGKNQPYTPAVGETYRLTVEFTVTGTPKNPYHVSFSMAGRDNAVGVKDLTPGPKSVSTEFWLSLDGKIPWEVEVDPFDIADADDPTKSKIPPKIPDPSGRGSPHPIGVKPSNLRLVGKKRQTGFFEPVPPAKGIEFFDPVWAVGAQSAFVKLASGGKIDRIAAMMGCPTTDSWQRVLSTVCRVESGAGDEFVTHRLVENASDQPVYYWNRKNVPVWDASLVQQFALKLQNVRVDASLLRAVTWSQLDALAGISLFKFFRSPEAVIESADPKITAFVKQTLGSSYRQHMTPYDAARKLFQAVLARTHYYFPAPGAADKRPATALGMLDKGFGDCGGFSILLVALYRNIGFPARSACGTWLGQDAGHCWCEMWFPGHGWMISDGSAGNSMSESGEYAYYFGNVLDLNARFAMMRGNTFNVDDVKTSWLQGPWGPNVWGTAKIASADVHTALVEVTQSAAESLAAAHAQDLKAVQLRPTPPAELRSTVRTRVAKERRAAFHACPCAEYGSFSPAGLRPARKAAPGLKLQPEAVRR